MNAPEGNMWNIREGIVLSARFAITRIHNFYTYVITNIQTRGTVTFNNGACCTQNSVWLCRLQLSLSFRALTHWSIRWEHLKWAAKALPFAEQGGLSRKVRSPLVSLHSVVVLSLLKTDDVIPSWAAHWQVTQNISSLWSKPSNNYAVKYSSYIYPTASCYYWLAEACEHYTLVIHYQTRTSKQRVG